MWWKPLFINLFILIFWRKSVRNTPTKKTSLGMELKTNKNLGGESEGKKTGLAGYGGGGGGGGGGGSGIWV